MFVEKDEVNDKPTTQIEILIEIFVLRLFRVVTIAIPVNQEGCWFQKEDKTVL